MAAQSDNTEIGNKLAGMTALSSADTYPALKVGEGADSGFDLTKSIEDKLNVVKQTLNPGYFRSFELDAFFPDDWKLEISVINSGFLDSLIGSSVIDLEDRFYGNLNNKQRLSYEINLKHFENEINRLLSSGGMLKNGKDITAFKEKKSTVISIMESRERKYETLVEYRPLKYPGKTVSQGSIEMALEVLPAEIGNYISIIIY